jgi:hypothetical protein
VPALDPLSGKLRDCVAPRAGVSRPAQQTLGVDDNQQPSPVAGRRLLSSDTVYGAGRSPLGTRPAGGKGTSLVCSLEQAAMSYLLRSARRLPAGSAPVRFQSGNSCDFAVNAGHWRHPLARQKRPMCRDIPRCAESRALLAMQKVEGSNPFSRFRKTRVLQVFLVGQSPCSSASGRTDSGLAARRSSAASRKTPGLQADSRSSELKSFCRPAEARVFCRLRPIAGFLQTAPLAYGSQPARWQRSRSAGGESDFSPETARPTSAAPRRCQPIAPRPVSSLRRAAPRQRRGARRGRLGQWQSRGVTAEGVLPSEAGVCSQTGRAPPHRPTTGVCDCRPFASAVGPVAGVGRQAALSVERDDDLAVGAALLDVRQRLEGLVERERLIDDRAEVAGVVEGGQLAQLPAVGLHEQKRVAHT